jgi:hypothetical protein
VLIKRSITTRATSRDVTAPCSATWSCQKGVQSSRQAQTTLTQNRAISNSSVLQAPDGDPQKGRTIVLCFDGTGDQFDGDNSNVIRFFSLLKKGDNNQQLVYYQVGQFLVISN